MASASRSVPRRRSSSRILQNPHSRRRLLLERLEDRALLAGFNFADFNESSTLSLLGDAAITADNRLRLTPAIGSQEGAAWYTAEKQFVGSEFSTAFQFQMADNFDSPGGSDGFVFLIQNTAPTYLSGGGGPLGYHELLNSIAVEFDTFQNSEAGDPSGSHISVHTNGTGPNSWLESLSLGSYTTDPILDDANIHTAKINYAPGTLSIYLDDMTTPKLTVSVNLAETRSLDAGTAWLGFTGTTGGGYQTHDILNWSFDTTVPATTLSINNVSQKEGDFGTSDFLFAVTRSGDVSEPATVDWATVDGSATASSGDYAAGSGQVSFAAGEASQTIAVAVIGDTAIESHETFSVKLTGATSGFVLDSVGAGTILNDETAISISDVAVTEGNPSIAYLGNLVSAQDGGLDDPHTMVYGPDGHLYVSTLRNNSVLRYDATTGLPLPAPGKTGAEFVSPGAGGLTVARGIAFGPDGNLYVSSQDSNAVLRYDAATGESLGALVTSASGGLVQPRGLLFHSDGYLYVTSVGAEDSTDAGKDAILRYDGATGDPAGISGVPGDAVFIPTGTGGLDNPTRIVLHNGHFYVASTSPSTSNSVLRFDTDGSFLDAFVPTGSGGLAGPTDLVFRDDYLYVSSWTNDKILRYDSETGAFVDEAVSGGGLDRPSSLLFDASGNFIVTSGDSDEIRRYGEATQAAFTVSLNSTATSTITVDYSTAAVSAVSGSDYSATTGTITFAPGQTSRTILVQTLDDAVYEGNETFVVNLSNASGGLIVDSQGFGTIVDNEPRPTKFYVVDDASANQTFEYADGGEAIENYGLDSANTAPRGAASNLAGDKVWVVDANRTVYVYNASGGQLGEWSVGGFNNSAQFVGIATDGTDVWIADAKSDKVYRFAGAASRLSGSQNAAGSFALNSGNKDASDLVTDGASIWVLNNASTDKVFKYTLSGSHLGNWTISAGGGSPTGITLDPANPSALWIVDNNTDRVYQYDGAVSRTSGSAAADAVFALAAGNTNPQGIADPPVSGGEALDGDALLADGSGTANEDMDLALLSLLADHDWATARRRK